MSALSRQDKEAWAILKKEEKRQEETLDLIASENSPSKAVREAESSIFMTKYSEGYPPKYGGFFYTGQENVIEVWEKIEERARKLFRYDTTWSVNPFALSGAYANLAVYFGLLKPRIKVKLPDGTETEEGDLTLAMKLDQGGHLSHGHKVTISGKVFRFIQYGVDAKGYIDYDEVERLAKEHKPRLIVCGASAYPRIIDFERFRQIADSCGAYLMADVAHIAGLIAGGVHPSPFPHCHIVTTTTHKTLRGPRGALIFAKNEVITTVNKALDDLARRGLFPGIQGGPHINSVFAIMVALGEAMKPSFKKYAAQIVKNAKVLADQLKKHGFSLVSDGTDNHLLLVDIAKTGLGGEEASARLYHAGIQTNKNAIPNDPRGPRDPSGIRLGTPYLTTRGMKEKEMKLIAEWIDQVLRDEREIPKVRKEVLKLCRKFPIT